MSETSHLIPGKPVIKVTEQGTGKSLWVYAAIGKRHNIQHNDTVVPEVYDILINLVIGYTMAYEDARLAAIESLTPSNLILGHPAWFVMHKEHGLCVIAAFVDICQQYGVNNMDVLDHEKFIELFNANMERYAQLREQQSSDYGVQTPT